MGGLSSEKRERREEKGGKGDDGSLDFVSRADENGVKKNWIWREDCHIIIDGGIEDVVGSGREGGMGGVDGRSVVVVGGSIYQGGLEFPSPMMCQSSPSYFTHFTSHLIIVVVVCIIR